MCSNLAAQPSGLRQGHALNWRRKWHPPPVVLPRKFHGWRGLVGYSPWGLKESDTIEQLHWVVHWFML